METYSSQSGKKSGSIRPILAVALSAFLLGAILVGYIAYKMDGRWDSLVKTATPAKLIGQSGGVSGAPDSGKNAAKEEDAQTAGQAEQGADEAAQGADQATQAVERVEQQQGGLDQRLAAAEQRLTRLDLQSQAATGNVARAEGLLIAFATRRTLERGAELGYLADQLRIRFSDALPNAVDTVIEASRDPITLDRLLARLEGLGPDLSDSAAEPSLDRIRRELGELFVIRRETSPSSQPARRLERARYFLESRRVSAAIEEVKLLPGAEHAASWIKDAERYAAAQRALDLIETSAVLEPRRLRDSEGNPVNQPSPVNQPALLGVGAQD